jgi:nitric oxide reductase NorQ protein
MALISLMDEGETAPVELTGGWRDLADALDAGIDRVILYGPPGTGKTYAALHFGVGDVPAERLVCTEDLTTADVTGCWAPVGEGRWEWIEGPAIRAWRHGARLVVDEVDRASGDVLSLLLAMTDSDGSTLWRHPRTGDVMYPNSRFSVVMTTNLDRVDELPPALLDRFPVAIPIDRPHPASVLTLSPDLRAAALNGSLGDPDRRVSLRRFAAFDRLRAPLGDERAAALVFGAARATAFLDALAISALSA